MKLVPVVEDYVWEEEEESSFEDEIIYVDEGDETTRGVLHVPLEENQHSYDNIYQEYCRPKPPMSRIVISLLEEEMVDPLVLYPFSF